MQFRYNRYSGMPTANKFFKELNFSDFYQRHKQEGWLVNLALLATTAFTALLPVLYLLAPELFVLTIMCALLAVGIALPTLAFLSLGKIKIDNLGIEFCRLGSLDEKLYAWSDLTRITFLKNGQPDPLRPTVMLIGSQHGNEPSGTEAVQILVRRTPCKRNCKPNFCSCARASRRAG